MDIRVPITWGFYSIKRIHTIIGRIYIDASFNVGISLIGVFPYLGGVISFQVGSVTKLEGYNSIWRVRGRFDRGVEEGGEEGKGGKRSELWGNLVVFLMN